MALSVTARLGAAGSGLPLWHDGCWGVVRGCTRVSSGCEHCMAEWHCARPPLVTHGVSRMTPFGPRWTGRVVTHPERLEEPLHIRAPLRLCVAAASDLFHDALPAAFLEEVWDVMRRATWHRFVVLTKRPERMRVFVRDHGAPDNVWIGVSVEDMERARQRVPVLLEVPARRLWVNAEPLLGPLTLSPWLAALRWVAAGPELGRGARPCRADWIRVLADECAAAGVPFWLNEARLDGELRQQLPVDLR